MPRICRIEQIQIAAIAKLMISVVYRRASLW